MMRFTRMRPLSRRKRHILMTAAVLAVAALVGTAALVRSYRQQQTAEYKPGEANPDITESLARDLPADAPRPVFVDVTEEAGLADFVTFAGPRTSQLPEDMGPGVAWGDYDNDGDDDLFLVSAGGALGTPADRLAPSALYENLGNGRFRRVASFPEPRIHGMAAAWGDYDGDGWLDLVVTGYDALLLFRNDRGTFTRDERFSSRKGFWAGAAWADYDNDGHLDLYVCGYVQYVPVGEGQRAAATQQYGRAVPFTLNPASYEPERNLLFRNTGRGTFVESAARLGVDNSEGRSLSALWHDFDDDGWLDLYVANDISDNVLYRNVEGRFTDVSHAAWVADYRGAMGLAAGDWNRDGDDDLFVTHWVAQENALYDSHFKDAGVLRFADAADIVGLGQIALPMVGWGAEFLDFDSDGWLDLAVANGSTFETDSAPRALVTQRPFLFWNRRGEHFHDVAPFAAPLATPGVARGLAVSDFDGDGDLDVLIARHTGGVQLLRNDTKGGHSAQVVLRARRSESAPAAVATGAAAVAQVGSARLRRAVTGASYLSQSTTMLHFGLGTASEIDKLTVRWRPGVVTEYGPLAAGRRWEIVEGEPAPRELARVAPGSTAGNAEPLSDRERVMAFWDAHRSAMHALRGEKDPRKAAGLFERALAIDPAHEDARYYLATALAAQGDMEGALRQYSELTRVNARSHRSLAGWGRLRALTQRNASDLAEAEEALSKAHDLNPEETGALLMLGEIGLMRGQHDLAERRLKAVAQANARAAGAWFLLGYTRWKARDLPHAREYLERSRVALGPEWKPAGSTAEGDVAGSEPHESTLLSRFWQTWDGAATPQTAFASLDTHLKGLAR
jgi:enediyne biosynthesis protein E4